jgi:hypothetical protein
MPKYAEICGYTETEIRKYFPDYLEETAEYMHITNEELMERMREYYNGFTFDDEVSTSLYNPFSTLSFFKEKKWYNYWIDTGSSKMIADYMKNRRLTVEQFRNFSISRDFVKSPGDLDSTPPEGFLYQGGYLTLRMGDNDRLCLDYPNTEVLNSMSRLLTQNFVSENAYNKFENALLVALKDKNVEKLIKVFNHLLAKIPYDDYTNAIQEDLMFDDFKFPAQEWLYRSSILSFLHGSGVNVTPEVHTNFGRIDLVVTYFGVTWVIEIKVAYKGDIAEKLEEALRQIEEKNYAKLYPDAVCIGLVIDDSVRQIANWELTKREKSLNF